MGGKKPSWHPGSGNPEQPQIGSHSSHQSHRVTFSDSEEPRTEGGLRVQSSVLSADRKSIHLLPHRSLPSGSQVGAQLSLLVCEEAAQLCQSHLPFPW